MPRHEQFDDLIVNTSLDWPEVRFSDGGVAATGDADIVVYERLGNNDTLEVTEVRIANADGSGVPSGCDVSIIGLDTPDHKVTVVSGDGSEKDVSGDPIASYQNTTGSPEDVAIVVDNGHFSSGSGSDQTVTISGEYRVS